MTTWTELTKAAQRPFGPVTRGRLVARWILAAVVAAGTASAGAFEPGSIAGVYKYRFTNAMVTGERFADEDVVEIVKMSPTEAYVKANLNFYNGHQCMFAVVAEVEDGALVYRSREGDPGYAGRRCELKVTVTPDRLVLRDKDMICRQASCGARGGYEGYEIDRKTRRPIRYLELLLHSDDYGRAIAEHARQ